MLSAKLTCKNFYSGLIRRLLSSMALTVDNMNPLVKQVEYAVRGPILLKALEIEREMQNGKKFPFENVIRANIGDCHATGCNYITFIRQVVALCTYPKLLDNNEFFPPDAKERAKRILSNCGGSSLGAYSQSPGIHCLRKDAADYIGARDGIPCDFKYVFASTGASDGIRTVLKLLLTGKSGRESAGVMIPIPQYPLYSAALTEYGAYKIDYFLDEDKIWAVTTEELNRAYEEAKDKCIPKAIVVINPGNPTGQVLNADNIANIIKFAKDRNLVLLADEVYQDNIYIPGMKFVSFRKVMLEMPYPYNTTQLASFHSASKGYMGECGARAGYFQLSNFEDAVLAQIQKLVSTNLCSPVWGQAIMDIIVNPPKKGDPSYDLFMKEKTEALEGFRKKAEMVTESLNKIEGIQCNPIQGALYAFPRLHLPAKFVKAMEGQKQKPDELYCMKLLEATGICVVPGSGFGQRPGTFHFRTTIIPPHEEMQSLLQRVQKFQTAFLKEYS